MPLHLSELLSLGSEWSSQLCLPEGSTTSFLGMTAFGTPEDSSQRCGCALSDTLPPSLPYKESLCARTHTHTHTHIYRATFLFDGLKEAIKTAHILKLSSEK